jgi:hypothetical protein
VAQFQAIAPGVEVSGAAVLSVIRGMPAFEARARRILLAHGMVDPREDRWYPQQAWLDAFRTIAADIGGATLTQIGKKIPESAIWPPVINTVAAALASIDVAYHLNHRGGEIGHYHFEPRGPRAAVMVCDNPYPCAFDQGIIEATARRFSPEGVFLWVTHDPSKACRQKGGESCTYDISW